MDLRDDQVKIRLGRLYEFESAHVSISAAARGEAGIVRARVVVARRPHKVGLWSHRAIGRVNHWAEVLQAIVAGLGVLEHGVQRDIAVESGLITDVALVIRPAFRPDVAVADGDGRTEDVVNALLYAVGDDGVVNFQRSVVSIDADAISVQCAVDQAHGGAAIGVDSPVCPGNDGVADGHVPAAPGNDTFVERLTDDAVGEGDGSSIAGADGRGRVVPVPADRASAIAHYHLIQARLAAIYVYPAPVANVRGALVAVIVGVAADRVVAQRGKDNRLGDVPQRDQFPS